MGLVTSKEIAKVINLDRFGWSGTFAGWLLLKTLRISKLNRIYERHKDKQDLVFLDALLDDFQIHFDIPQEDLDRIPITTKADLQRHPVEETVESFEMLVTGELDHLPEQAFLNVGDADSARAKAAELEEG